MKGNTKVLEILNEVLTGELTAINQYFLHAKMCYDWGYEDIGAKVKHESIDEMKHADKLVERILFLEGIPNLQKLGKLSIGENVKEQFENDLALEMDALALLRRGIKLCLEEADVGSRELLEHILVDEEHHVDWLEAQLHMIKEMGYENYLASQKKSES